MEKRRSKRGSLRIPVYLASHCTLADGSTIEAKVINLGPEGILIESSDPIEAGECLELEFLLPGSLNSMRLTGQVIWSRVSRPSEDQEAAFYLAGIKFTDHDELYRSLLRDYTMRMLDNDDLLRDGGILLVLEDLRNFSPKDRLKAYHILIGKE
jgi:hypothetical protein